MKNNIMLFFDTILFIDPLSVKPIFFLHDGIKNDDVVFCFFIVWNKTMQTFDIVWKKIFQEKINSMVLFYDIVLIAATKRGIRKQNYNVINRIKFRTDAQCITHKTMQKK